MLANCGVLGLDWERVSLSGYMEALEVHNDAHEPAEKAKGAEKKAPSDWLKNAMKNKVWG